MRRGKMKYPTLLARTESATFSTFLFSTWRRKEIRPPKHCLFFLRRWILSKITAMTSALFVLSSIRRQCVAPTQLYQPLPHDFIAKTYFQLQYNFYLPVSNGKLNKPERYGTSDSSYALILHPFRFRVEKYKLTKWDNKSTWGFHGTNLHIRLLRKNSGCI